MKAKEFITEKLKPSQYRPLVKGWDKARYADIFGGQYRIYIPLTQSNSVNAPAPNPIVAQAVQSAGYQIDDYVSGLASKPGDKRKVRIGKIIKDPVVQQAFTNDPARQASKTAGTQMVVISRHPYDIAGMSTDRGWTSCMNLVDGENKNYIPLDIKEGSVIAYLINSNDKNIQNPIARMMIKPFINTIGNHEVAFGIENAVYGSASPAFNSTVTKWVNNVNASRKLSGVFKVSPEVYRDSNEINAHAFIGDKAAIYQEIFNNPKKYVLAHPNLPEDEQLTAVNRIAAVIQFIKKPTDRVKSAAVKKDPMAIRHIQNPSRQLWLASLREAGDMIQYVKDPDREMQMTAISNTGRAIRFIENPDKEIQIAAMRRSGLAIQFIDDPDPDVQMQAVHSHAYAIHYIKNPDKKVQLYVVSKVGDLIQNIKNPDPDVQAAAVDNDWGAIRNIRNPTEQAQLIAVKQHGRIISVIDNPSKAVQIAAVKEDPSAIAEIRNPCKEAKKIAKERYK